MQPSEGLRAVRGRGSVQSDVLAKEMGTGGAVVFVVVAGGVDGSLEREVVFSLLGKVRTDLQGPRLVLLETSTTPRLPASLSPSQNPICQEDKMSSFTDNLAPSFAPFFGMVSAAA